MCKKVIVLSMLLVSMGWLSSAALAQPPVKTGLVLFAGRLEHRQPHPIRGQGHSVE